MMQRYTYNKMPKTMARMVVPMGIIITHMKMELTV